MFGGQVAGQALVAAGRTVESDRPVHSLHAYFLRPGDPTVPIVYDVDRIRDGRSFTTRRVVAIQHGRAIFNLSASFHVEEPGPEHQYPMPDVPDAGDAADVPRRRSQFAIASPPEMRGVARARAADRPAPDRAAALDRSGAERDAEQDVWIRANGSSPTTRCCTCASSPTRPTSRCSTPR